MGSSQDLRILGSCQGMVRRSTSPELRLDVWRYLDIVYSLQKRRRLWASEKYCKLDPGLEVKLLCIISLDHFIV